jgi:hypothetical protein
MSWIDWTIVISFFGYIGYVYYRARQNRKG